MIKGIVVGEERTGGRPPRPHTKGRNPLGTIFASNDESGLTSLTTPVFTRTARKTERDGASCDASGRKMDVGSSGSRPRTPCMSCPRASTSGCSADEVTPIPSRPKDASVGRLRAPRKRDVMEMAGPGPKALVQAAVTKLRAVQNSTPPVSRRRQATDAPAWDSERPPKAMRLGDIDWAAPSCFGAADARRISSDDASMSDRAGPSGGGDGAFSPGPRAGGAARAPAQRAVAGGISAVISEAAASDRNAKKRLEELLEDVEDVCTTPMPSRGGLQQDCGMDDVIARLDGWC